MGQTESSFSQNPVNYDCSVCMSSGNLPNIAGRFFLINETHCKCNGCNTVYDKTLIYKSYITNAINVNLEKPTI